MSNYRSDDRPPAGRKVRIEGKTDTPRGFDADGPMVDLRGELGTVQTANPHYHSKHHREQCTVVELEGGGTVSVPTRQLAPARSRVVLDLTEAQREKLAQILRHP